MKPNNKKIYITGASGRLGKAVLKLIPNAIPIDLRNTETDLKAKLADANAVIHIAGSMKFNNKKELWNANHLLTKTVAEATPKAAKLIYASSISVYGKKLAEVPANEETSCNPDNEYSKSKYAGEKEVLKRQNSVILRIGTIYGPGFEDYFKMIEYIEKGKMAIIGDGKNRLPFVHVNDVAKAIANSVEVKSGTYVLCADPITQEKTYEIVCKQLGVKMPTKRIGKMTSKLLFKINSSIKKLTGKKEFLTSEHMEILANDRPFNCSKAKKMLGFKPRKTEDGIREMVNEYLKNSK